MGKRVTEEWRIFQERVASNGTREKMKVNKSRDATLHCAQRGGDMLRYQAE